MSVHLICIRYDGIRFFLRPSTLSSLVIYLTDSYHIFLTPPQGSYRQFRSLSFGAFVSPSIFLIPHTSYFICSLLFEIYTVLMYWYDESKFLSAFDAMRSGFQPPSPFYDKAVVYINHWCCPLFHLINPIHNLLSLSNLLNTFRSDDSWTGFIPTPFAH